VRRASCTAEALVCLHLSRCSTYRKQKLTSTYHVAESFGTCAGTLQMQSITLRTTCLGPNAQCFTQRRASPGGTHGACCATLPTTPLSLLYLQTRCRSRQASHLRLTMSFRTTQWLFFSFPAASPFKDIWKKVMVNVHDWHPLCPFMTLCNLNLPAHNSFQLYIHDLTLIAC